MSYNLETKDAAQLSDSEIEEMANLAAHTQDKFDIGYLSKQVEEWVLVTRCYEANKLRAWCLYSLERIGGTPAMILGLGYVEKNSKSELYLKHLLGDQYRKALLAFPDEDVLVGTKIVTPEAFRIFNGLHDIIPSPGHKLTGEERAWCRRLAKRFNRETNVDDRTLLITGADELGVFFDFCGSKTVIDTKVAAQLKPLKGKPNDALIVCGWAMAEDLAANKLGL
jgi:hypothetical protein